MEKTEKAGLEFCAVDELAHRASFLHSVAPEVKLFVTVLFLFLTVSFPKYDLYGLFVMVLFPVIGYQLAELPVHTCFYKLRFLLPVVALVGIANPFLDRSVVGTIGGMVIHGGVLSFLTLLLKGCFCLMASFLLMATTPIEELCGALSTLHVPKVFTSLLLLTYRYITLLLEEVTIMTQAYKLRAPGQKGIRFPAWGSFLGQLILRSMDRAERLYDSMRLRGFDGNYPHRPRNNLLKSGIYLLTATVAMLLVRFVPVAELLGSLFS